MSIISETYNKGYLTIPLSITSEEEVAAGSDAEISLKGVYQRHIDYHMALFEGISSNPVDIRRLMGADENLCESTIDGRKVTFGGGNLILWDKEVNGKIVPPTPKEIFDAIAIMEAATDKYQMTALNRNNGDIMILSEKGAEEKLENIQSKHEISATELALAAAIVLTLCASAYISTDASMRDPDSNNGEYAKKAGGLAAVVVGVGAITLTDILKKAKHFFNNRSKINNNHTPSTYAVFHKQDGTVGCKTSNGALYTFDFEEAKKAVKANPGILNIRELNDKISEIKKDNIESVIHFV